MSQVITIYTESSPNPNSIKFVLNIDLLDNISFDFPSKEEADLSPLAQTLFDEYSFIKRIFIAANFVAITKDDATEWLEVNHKIMHFIKSYIEDKKPIFVDNIKQQVVKEDNQEQTSETEIEAKIKAVLDEYVRPAVEQDGGAIQFHSFEDGVVKVLMQGACSGCPSSTMTLKSGIENLLTRMVPGVKEVVAEGV